LAGIEVNGEIYFPEVKGILHIAQVPTQLGYFTFSSPPPGTWYQIT